MHCNPRANLFPLVNSLWKTFSVRWLIPPCATLATLCLELDFWDWTLALLRSSSSIRLNYFQESICTHPATIRCLSILLLSWINQQIQSNRRHWCHRSSMKQNEMHLWRYSLMLQIQISSRNALDHLWLSFGPTIVIYILSKSFNVHYTCTGQSRPQQWLLKSLHFRWIMEYQ